MALKSPVVDDFPRVDCQRLRFFLFVLKELGRMYIATVQSRPAMIVIALFIGATNAPSTTNILKSIGM